MPPPLPSSSAYARRPVAQPPPKQVKVARVIDTPLERTTVALGSLVAFDQATISVKVPGRLRSITVDLGSLVQRGQLIAQIEPQDYQLRVQQAEAAMAQARVRLGLPATGTNDLPIRPINFQFPEFQAVRRGKYPTPAVAGYPPAILTRVSTDVGFPLQQHAL